MDRIIKSLDSSLMLEYQELVDQFDIESFKGHSHVLTEGVFDSGALATAMLSTERDIVTRYIGESFELLRTTSVDRKAVEEFFAKIYNSPALAQLNLTIPVSSPSDVEKIRPQYLEVIVNDVSRTIDQIFKGTIDKDGVARMCDDMYAKRVRAQLVKTSIPPTMKLGSKDAYCKDNLPFNNQFITTTLLPFLRSLPQMIKEMEITSTNTISAVNTSTTSFEDMVNTTNRLKKEKNLDYKQGRTLDFYIYNISRILMDSCKYLTSMVVHKINLITYNMYQFNVLYKNILRYYPEGSSLMHESVMDGSFEDIDNDQIVMEMLSGNASTLHSICDALIDKQRSDISYLSGPTIGDNDHSDLDDRISGCDFSSAPYHNGAKMIQDISQSLDSLAQNAKDPEMVYDQIVQKAGLESSLGERFSVIMPTLSDCNYYNDAVVAATTSDDLEEVIMTIIAELKHFNSNMTMISNGMTSIYKKLLDTTNSIKDNVNGEYGSPQTQAELLDFLGKFRSEYRNTVLSITLAYLDRLKEMNHILQSVDKKLVTGDERRIEYTPVTDEDNDDYYEMAIDNIMEEREVYMKYTFEQMLIEYTKERTFHDRGVQVVYEANNTAAPAGTAQNAQPASQPANDKKDKVEVTANKETEAQNTQNVKEEDKNPDKKDDGNKDEKKKGTFKDVMDSVSNFLKGCINKFRDSVQKHIDKANEKTNASWIERHKDGLLTRAYNGIKMRIFPYINVNPTTITGEIDKVTAKINAINPKEASAWKNQDDMKKFILGDILSDAITQPLGQALQQHYEVGKAQLQEVEVGGSQLKEQVPQMIEYCEGFYGNFGSQVSTSLSNLDKAVENCIQRLSSSQESGDLLTKAQWLSSLSQQYAGAVLNAVTRRNNDNLNRLNQLTPESTAKEAEKNTAPEEKTENKEGNANAQGGNAGGENK